MENRLVEFGELFKLGESSLSSNKNEQQLSLDHIPMFLSAQSSGSSNSEDYLILCTAASWHYPSFTTLGHFIHARDELRPEGLHIFVVDQEAEREYCMKNEILVGPARIYVWRKGSTISFERKNGKELGYILGPMNQRQIQSMITSIQETEQSENKIVLKF